MDETRNEALQRLCRDYLGRLRYVASKHGLLPQLNNLIAMNKRRECVSTEREVQMLSRKVDDERVSRTDIPKEHIKKLKHQGIYSKVSALLYKSRKKP